MGGMREVPRILLPNLLEYVIPYAAPGGVPLADVVTPVFPPLLFDRKQRHRPRLRCHTTVRQRFVREGGRLFG